jgi:hypothetical protein
MRTFCLLLTLLCTGCISLRFDSLEYDRYISIKEHIISLNSSCGTSRVISELESLRLVVDHQLQYSSNKVHHTEFTNSIGIINTMIIDMQLKYHTTPLVSTQYCKLKTNNMLIGTTFVIQEMGKL